MWGYAKVKKQHFHASLFLMVIKLKETASKIFLPGKGVGRTSLVTIVFLFWCFFTASSLFCLSKDALIGGGVISFNSFLLVSKLPPISACSRVLYKLST